MKKLMAAMLSFVMAMISYCTRTTGGTAYTVKYALEHGITVYNASSFDVSALLQARPLGKNG